MLTNEPTTKRKKRIPEIKPAGGMIRRNYDDHRIRNLFALMFYSRGKSADVRDLLREMFSAWLMAEESAHYTREHLRRCNEMVNDLCRIVEEAGS